MSAIGFVFTRVCVGNLSVWLITLYFGLGEGDKDEIIIEAIPYDDLFVNVSAAEVTLQNLTFAQVICLIHFVVSIAIELSIVSLNNVVVLEISDLNTMSAYWYRTRVTMASGLTAALNCGSAYLVFTVSSCHWTASNAYYWTICTLFVAMTTLCLGQSAPA